MIILWIILGVIGGIIALLLIIAAFSRKAYSVERSIVMERSISETYQFMTSIQNQDRYSKWANMDPNMRKKYTGTDRQIGFISRWESDEKNVGVGEQEIVGLEENKLMRTELRFDVNFTFESFDEDQTKVTWKMSSKMPYPMNIMLVFMNMEKMLGDDFEVGLKNAKDIFENEI
jgi:hypothetical protein